MDKFSRRDFLRRGSLGLAVAGVAGCVLRSDAQPTPASGGLGAFAGQVEALDKAGLVLPEKAKLTEDNIEGPFYRPGAPFRAKITPPFEPGKVLVITGRVWGFDTKKPLAGAVLDVWQANAKGRYDNDDPQKPPAKDVFVNRARLITDETGYYEYETIHPGAYQIGPEAWRPSHIHYLIRHAGYKPLITQLYFKGDPHNKTDEFIKESLIIEVREQKVGTNVYEVGTFDIVLAAAPKK
jgi:protocatechuate 3,4-dioxygenase beta subunit